jgi:3-oxoacyl-[acyl-carrier-protein] synthase-3
MQQTYSVIIGSGSYIPTRSVFNKDFLNHTFFDQNGERLAKANELIIDQLEQITGILERKYVTDDLLTSDIAFLAGLEALSSSQTDPESLDYIIVAHNFGDISATNRKSEMVPALASRVKHKLDIKNPQTIAYDLPFGCAGWLQAVIQADFYIKSGCANKVLVIGAETLSRVCDPHDRDSMIYADGAGAVILGAVKSTVPVGILSHTSRTYADELTYALKMGPSFNAAYKCDQLFLKMNGRKIYEQVLKIVPGVIKESLLKAEIALEDVSKVLIHQANNKMDEAILKLLYELYDIKDSPVDVMPMTISWLGNSSVATLPTLYDLIAKGQMQKHQFNKNGILVFAAVGAGVNVNAVIYKLP